MGDRHPALENFSPLEPQSFSKRVASLFNLGDVAIIIVALNVVSWFEATGLLVVIAYLFAIGLCCQAFDITRLLWKTKGLSSEERFALLFAIIWRVAVAFVLFAYHPLIALNDYLRTMARERAIVLGQHYHRSGVDWPPEKMLLNLSLIVALASTLPRHIARSPRTATSRVISAAGVVAGFLLGMLIWTQGTQLHWLVYWADTSVERAMPLDRPLSGRDFEAMINGPIQFAWIAAMASLVAVVNLLLCSRLAKHWDRINRRWLYLLLLAIGLTITVGYCFWLYPTGISLVSPAFSVSSPRTSLLNGISGVAMLVLLVTVVTFRTVARPASEPRTKLLTWRGKEWRYLHERFSVHLMLIGGVSWILFGIREFVDNYTDWGSLVTYLPLYFRLAIWLLTAKCLVCALRFDRPITRVSPVTLPPGKFAVLWFAELLGIGSGIVILAALSFSVWLTPWDRWTFF